jgi:hypothetical protein
MSMLIGAGNALQNFGQQLGQGMLASQDRKRQDEQRAFQNMMAQKNFDLEQGQQAQAQANIERERIFKVLSSLPSSTSTIPGEIGQDMLKRGGPEMGLFLQPDRNLPTRQFGMTEGGGLAPGASQGGDLTGDFRVQRPESDAYARVMADTRRHDLDRQTRVDSSIRRAATGNAANTIRLQIARMTDQRQRQMAEAALGQASRQFGEMMALRNDQSDLAWANADAELMGEYQKLVSNMMMAPPPGITAPRVGGARRPPRGGAGTTPAARDPNDDLIDSVFGPTPQQ